MAPTHKTNHHHDNTHNNNKPQPALAKQANPHHKTNTYKLTATQSNAINLAPVHSATKHTQSKTAKHACLLPYGRQKSATCWGRHDGCEPGSATNNVGAIRCSYCFKCPRLAASWLTLKSDLCPLRERRRGCLGRTSGPLVLGVGWWWCVWCCMREDVVDATSPASR